MTASADINFKRINKEALTNLLKSMIGELAWGMEAYYRIKNYEDNVVIKAASVLK